jgi:hypothetical protein
MSDISDTETIIGRRKRKRPSTTLKQKLEVVLRYLEFARQKKEEHKYDRELADDYDNNLRCEKSINNFLDLENANWPADNQLGLANVFKWLKAYDRGDYYEWGGVNKLDKSNARSKDIQKIITDGLKAKFPVLHKLLKVLRSPSSPDMYGVVAREYITCGTFLGFVEGEIKDINKPFYAPPEGPHAFTVVQGDNSVYIDCSHNFTSCFGRYINSSTQTKQQNVCVVRLHSSDPCRQVCFIANEDIPRNTELIIGVHQGYSKRKSGQQGTYQRYTTVQCKYSTDFVAMFAAQYLQKEANALAGQTALEFLQDCYTSNSGTEDEEN